MNVVDISSGNGADGRPMRLRVQVLDDDPMTVAMLTHVLTGQNWEAVSSSTIAAAKASLNNWIPDIAIVDVYLGQEDGLDFVKYLKKHHQDVGIVVISSEDTEILARTAITSGADFFLSKPVLPNALIITAKSLGELRRKRQEASNLKTQLAESIRNTMFPEIITHSDSMGAVLRLIERVSKRDLAVLVFGESGTGKELVARAIHSNGPRRDEPFVELNCAALPPNLVESELFGHEKGAFTGAVASRSGKLERADGGTLFLDEIGELPLEIQPKLLRALQEKRIQRVGGKDDIQTDFRLVCATNRDLMEEVRQNRFREDLFYRVAVFPIKLPPLRDRIEDMDLLLAEFLKLEGMRNPMIAPDAAEVLRSYRWPGNVRELKNFAQAIPLLTDHNVIDLETVRTYFGTRLGDINPMFLTRDGSMGSAAGSANRPVRKLADVERDEIMHALTLCGGNVPEAAMALGMGRATLYKYLKRHDIDVDAILRR